MHPMHSRFIYPTSYLSIPTCISNRHLKLNISNIKFLIIFPPISFHSQSFSSVSSIFPVALVKNLDYILDSSFSVTCTLAMPANVVDATFEICQHPPSLYLHCSHHEKHSYNLSLEFIHSLLIGLSASTYHSTISAQESSQNHSCKTYIKSQTFSSSYLVMAPLFTHSKSQSLYNDLEDPIQSSYPADLISYYLCPWSLL